MGGVENAYEWDHFLTFHYIAYVSGFCSTGCWILVQLPQIYKNYCRKRTDGVSVWWALANFLAAINNTFFLFRTPGLPLYITVSGVWFDFANTIILMQVLYYDSQREQKMMSRLFHLGVVILTGALLFIQSYFPSITVSMQWVSVVLWSIETLPQIHLNNMHRRTDDLSKLAVGLTVAGKTFDFMGNFLNKIDIVYVIMTFCSSCTAFYNAYQVIYFSVYTRSSTHHAGKGQSSSTEELMEMDREGASHKPALYTADSPRSLTPDEEDKALDIKHSHPEKEVDYMQPSTPIIRNATLRRLALQLVFAYLIMGVIIFHIGYLVRTYYEYDERNMYFLAALMAPIVIDGFTLASTIWGRIKHH
eukprot:Nk52_evm18s163 gene=Nk52_evmTU18s163